MRGVEEYEELRKSFAPVLDEINNLIATPFIDINGCPVELKLLFGGDYKVFFLSHQYLIIIIYLDHSSYCFSWASMLPTLSTLVCTAT